MAKNHSCPLGQLRFLAGVVCHLQKDDSTNYDNAFRQRIQRD